ncbi:MAG: thioredoxin domain-containing protein [bacterium]
MKRGSKTDKLNKINAYIKMSNIYKSKRIANHLAHEKSPYLLQHAHNPVDWYPWGEKVFQKARKENKPLFLSIGYSTCHWCHVMAKESFEDDEVARLLNNNFICIKVDREERPDIDSVFMKVCQLLTGGGGWPLTIIMTPDKRPFFAATYIPKEDAFGQRGLLSLLPYVKNVWNRRQAEINTSIESILASLKRLEEIPLSGVHIDSAILRKAYGHLMQDFDKDYGGFGKAPKFPFPSQLFFLLRYWDHTADDHACFMVEKTLQRMRKGGIFDHIGYGFHRYSTDAQWHVPHFEKMLYDQALLAIAYSEAYQATNKTEYKMTVSQIFTYVVQNLTAPTGGFFCAEDADSEGEEGKFYLWRADEIEEVLTPDEARIIKTVFTISDEGNFQQTGHNIFHMQNSLDDIGATLGCTFDEITTTVETARLKLFSVRERRIHPHRDDKILTSWNGLMIAALANGYQILSHNKYLSEAQKAAHFILTRMHDTDGRLLHRFCDGQAAIMANLDDYAFFIWGLLDLYEACFDVHYLDAALTLNDQVIKYFWDEKNGGFFYTACDEENILIREKSIQDGALPSGNAVAMLNLLKLGHITGNSQFLTLGHKLSDAFSYLIHQTPGYFPQFLVALDFLIRDVSRVVISGDPKNNDTQEMLYSLRHHFIPHKIVLLSAPDKSITRHASFTDNCDPLEGKATAYICRNQTCMLPTTDCATMLSLLINKNK